MIKLVLENEKGKEVTYTVEKVKARVLKQGLMMFSNIEKKGASELELIDGMVDLIVSAFNNKEVTADAIYDGLYAEDFFATVQDVVQQIMGGSMPSDESEGK